ncbi:MAG: hypothetical protein GX998_06050 [Firmicutes bacterium]|nr:hypothetical protein [Bacillota bacterium]
MKHIRNGLLALGIVLAMTVGGLAFSTDDFLPPVEGGRTEIVAVVNEADDGIVEAETAQDGFNYASQKLRDLGGGFRQVMFGSGLGYMAGVTESYVVFENPNATQHSLRLAYVRAYTKAKAELTRGLRGLSGRGRDRLQESLDEVTTGAESAYNFSTIYEEDLQQAVEGLLRGYVVYEVEHRPEKKQVYVSLATSLKTISAVSNISGAVVQTSSLRAGMDYVLQQINLGIVPPVGGKIVFVPSTGETAVISFGSDIIRQHDDPTMARRLFQVAERVATVRANDAMIGLMNGDQVTWNTGLRTTTAYSQQEFQEVVEDDPTIQHEVLDEVQHRFLNTMAVTDDYRSFRSGQMPPGVNTQLKTDEYWVYAVNVYLPSVSGDAAEFYRQMQSPAQKSGSGNRRLSDTYEPGSDAPVQQAPTGKVSSEDDL